MSRTVAEWIGKTDDTPVPERVRLRVLARFNGRCYLCTRLIRPGEYWECDHVEAIINGGANREKNLAPACCNCCRPKTAQDVAQKSDTYDKRRKHALPRQHKGRIRSRNTFRPAPSNARDINSDIMETSE